MLRPMQRTAPGARSRPGRPDRTGPRRSPGRVPVRRGFASVVHDGCARPIDQALPHPGSATRCKVNTCPTVPPGSRRAGKIGFRIMGGEHGRGKLHQPALDSVAPDASGPPGRGTWIIPVVAGGYVPCIGRSASPSGQRRSTVDAPCALKPDRGVRYKGRRNDRGAWPPDDSGPRISSSQGRCR